VSFKQDQLEARRRAPIPTMFPFLETVKTDKQRGRSNCASVVWPHDRHRSVEHSDCYLCSMTSLRPQTIRNQRIVETTQHQHVSHKSSLATVKLDTESRSTNLSSLGKGHNLTNMISAPFFMMSGQKSPKPTGRQPDQKSKPEAKMNSKSSLTSNDQAVDEKDEETGDITTPTKSPAALQKRHQSVKHDRKFSLPRSLQQILTTASASPITMPKSPSALRDPNINHTRRKSVTFSTLLNGFPSPKVQVQPERPTRVIPDRPARDMPTPNTQRQLSAFETGFSFMTSLGLCNANETKPPSLTVSPLVSRIGLRYASNETRNLSSESKPSPPVSKVKALAQAFNNLTAPNGPVRRRGSVSGHRRSDSWTEKVRRSISLSSKSSPVSAIHGLPATREDVEPGAVKQQVEDVVEGKVAEGEVQLASSPPRSPSILATEHIETPPANPTAPKLANSPPGSPSMLPTSTQDIGSPPASPSFPPPR
jgi:hypothetical protein